MHVKSKVIAFTLGFSLDCCDEIDMDYTTCCALSGSNCPAVCP